MVQHALRQVSEELQKTVTALRVAIFCAHNQRLRGFVGISACISAHRYAILLSSEKLLEGLFYETCFEFGAGLGFRGGFGCGFAV
jgi:hypothetical protein